MKSNEKRKDLRRSRGSGERRHTNKKLKKDGRHRGDEEPQKIWASKERGDIKNGKQC